MNEASAALSRVCGGCGARYPSDALFCPLDGMPLQSAASAGREAEDDPYLGQQISGHIEIRQLVGIGAMGRVYRAFQKGIDRDVAVKILHRELSANAQLVSRFTREAKVASRLQHPNVVQVLLAGQLPDRALYMVMEYLEGLSLQSALAAAGGALPMPKALHIALQLCEASGEAHAVGIVHRDLKPENVMLVRRGTDPDFVKVLDFGIARINWGEPSVATAAGLIFGTARYISPEGAQGNAVGPASDVYSIATLLYQMLAGRTPFEGDQAVGLLVSQIHDAPPHLKSLPRAEYVPDPLAEVIMANLVKDPNRREQDARALGHAIIDAAKEAGLAPEDISRPMLRRQPSAMQLSPTKRTKDLDLSPEVSERLSLVALPAAHAAASPPNGAGRDRAPMGATAKWEPPTELQARLTAVAEGTRDSGVVPARSIATTPSRPRTPASVDATMDDASLEGKSMPRTMPGDVELRAPATQYAAPAPGLTDGPAHVGSAALPSRAEPSRPLPVPEGTSSPTRLDGGDEPRRSRGVPFVLLCFALGAALAAGWAWRTGKLGGADADDEHYVSRATDAMYKNRFVTPPGDNVREITDEGLKKWPNHHRLLDVRMRAANELVSQAMTQRSAGDIVEALRVARAAHELDPNDASAKRLVDQYEGELAAFTTPTATPLNKTAPVVPVPNGRPPLVVPSGNLASSAATPFKAILETNVAQPRLGQTIELTARVAPAKGTFEAPLFTLNGPGLGAGVTMPAQSPAPGVFKASYAFLEGGRFDATFTAQAEGKPLRAMRAISVGDPTQPKPADPPPKPTAPTPTASVKWM